MAKRKERTRNGGRWTEARFFQFIRTTLRAGMLKWGPKYEALQRQRRPVPEERRKSKQQKWEYQCEGCGEWFMGKDVQVDHFRGAGSCTSFEDLPGYVERMFCEADLLQVLCKWCHQEQE